MSNNETGAPADKHPVANKILIYGGSFMMISSLIVWLVSLPFDKFTLKFLGNALMGALFLLMGLKNRSPEKYGSRLLTVLMVIFMIAAGLIISYDMLTGFSK